MTSKEKCMKVYKEEKSQAKRCIYQSKKRVNEQFGRKMNQGVSGNNKLFWKEEGNEELQTNKGWKWKIVQDEV